MDISTYLKMSDVYKRIHESGSEKRKKKKTITKLIFKSFFRFIAKICKVQNLKFLTFN